MVYKVDGNPQLDTCDWSMYSNIRKSCHKTVVGHQNGRKSLNENMVDFYSRRRQIACPFLYFDFILQFYNQI